MSGKPKKADISSDETETVAGGTGTADTEQPGLAATPPGPDQVDLKAQAEENWDKYVRALAELDNVRKRAQRDVENARKFALERFAADLLAVRDSLELGLTASEQTDVSAMREGFEATLKLLASTMEQFGIREIDPLGEPFDPQLHEAISMQPSGTMEPGSVLTVFQKGYILNGRLLRPARVVVSAEPAAPA
ncbi:MAG: nucleotide exchange factor GrpE [Woeseiaceae bacterium]|nr:nucleotide exchange factor GrpE [Woeseiaceae bacterium]